MIIYGWNTKTLKEAPLPAHSCTGCNEKNSHIVILAHYFHIFWIPVFVYKKSAHIVCLSCKLSMESKEYGSEMGELKQNLKMLKSSVKSPWYLYIGAILVGLFIAYIVYISNQNSQQKQDYINNPQIGDVYLLKDLQEPTTYNHYLMKTVDTQGDSLLVVFNSYSYNGIVDKLDSRDGFYDIMYIIHKDELKEMDESGELKKIFREYSSYSGFDRELVYPDSLESE